MTAAATLTAASPGVASDTILVTVNPKPAITLEQRYGEMSEEDTKDLLRRTTSNARKLHRLLTNLLDLTIGGLLSVGGGFGPGSHTSLVQSAEC